MIDEQVCDNDLIIVEDRTTPENGEMVLALLEDKNVFLRKYYLEGQRVRLQPTNSAADAWLVDKEAVRVRGVVVGLMRRYL